MMFANRFDIAEYVRTFGADPILGPAARTLENLADAADANSDGWAYWPKPARAAAALIGILETERSRRYRYDAAPAPTADDVRRALRPVRAFRTRSGIPFEIENV